MSYSPGRSPDLTLRHSLDSWTSLGVENIAAVSGVWPSANLAIYVPILVTRPSVVRKLWYANGTTATGNLDMGLYDSSGTRLTSTGAQAKTTTSAEIIYDVTDLTLGIGRYYVALASDSGTDTFVRGNPAAPECVWVGLLSEASAYPLPATATWAVDQTLAYIPMIGVFLEATAA